jgi:hypothetical protein
MAMRIQQEGMMSRALLVLATAGMLAGVAACGSVTAGSGSHPAAAASGGTASTAVPLCANKAHLDRMVVSVNVGRGLSHLHELLPIGITIRDPARVQAVATALCGLPATAHTQVRCPADFGSGYRLVFSAAGQTFPPVVIRATGCRLVSGLGPVRTTSGSFWALLHRNLGGRPVGATAPHVSTVPAAS